MHSNPSLHSSRRAYLSQPRYSACRMAMGSDFAQDYPEKAARLPNEYPECQRESTIVIPYYFPLPHLSRLASVFDLCWHSAPIHYKRNHSIAVDGDLALWS